MTSTADSTTGQVTRLAVVSGMSGSGKTIALRMLEDLDYYCVDNLPSALMPAFVAAVTQSQPGLHPRLAVGIDVRNRADDLNKLPEILAELARQGIEHQLIFLDARDDILFKRYSDTRRRHPLSGDKRSLADAIVLERKLLKPVASIAERVIDTSDLNIHQLRRLIATELGMAGGPLSLMFESFAYKRGVPADADFVFDARCLPNPHWETRLRPLSGRDAAVREWLAAKPEVGQYLAQVRDFLDTWLPRFEADNRSYVTICVGCTGGRHRSVYLCELLAEHFRATREQVLTFHRELE
jgi:RNase adapter protein RapZ